MGASRTVGGGIGATSSAFRAFDQRHMLALGANCHALPKRDVPCDVFSSLFGSGIIPGCILVDLVAYDKVVVARLSFPRASAMRGALLKILAVDRGRGEIMIPFDNLGVVAFGEQNAVPCGLRHRCPTFLYPRSGF